MLPSTLGILRKLWLYRGHWHNFCRKKIVELRNIPKIKYILKEICNWKLFYFNFPSKLILSSPDTLLVRFLETNDYNFPVPAKELAWRYFFVILFICDLAICSKKNNIRQNWFPIPIIRIFLWLWNWLLLLLLKKRSSFVFLPHYFGRRTKIIIAMRANPYFMLCSLEDSFYLQSQLQNATHIPSTNCLISFTCVVYFNMFIFLFQITEHF